MRMTVIDLQRFNTSVETLASELGVSRNELDSVVSGDSLLPHSSEHLFHKLDKKSSNPDLAQFLICNDLSGVQETEIIIHNHYPKFYKRVKLLSDAKIPQLIKTYRDINNHHTNPSCLCQGKLCS